MFLIVHIYRTAKHELHLECAKAECDIVRKESEICKTRYPILLVHGIFFRDWQLFNYWGRIPAELQKNGAVIFYGKQQSAQSISESARELAAQIKAICTETGAEKSTSLHIPKAVGLPMCTAGLWSLTVCGITDNDQHTPSWMRFCR
ncbi:MAG: esterase/lipase family protein [Ruminococcus sp.]